MSESTLTARQRPALRKGGRWRINLAAYLFLLPQLSVFLIFVVLPVVFALVLAFMDYRPTRLSFVGFDNFRRVFTDPLMGIALRNTSIFTVGVVVFWLGKALLIAYLIDPLSKSLQTFFKSAFYLPTVTSGVIISLIWLWIFNPTFGLLNAIMNVFGFENVAWLGNPNTALASLIGMQVIMGGGSSIVLLSAALARIPRDLYEVAILDGATRGQMFRNIIIPLIKPVLLYLVVTGTINTFQVFESIYIMTQGGPQFATITLVYRIYTTAFQQFNLGLASAQAIVLFAFTFLLAWIQFRWLGQNVEY